MGEMRGIEGREDCRRRLCQLLHKVHERRFGYGTGPCDCVCEKRKASPEYWRSTGEALEWLEKLVESLPDGNVPVEVLEQWTIGTDGRPEYRRIMVKVAEQSSAEKKP